MTASAAENAEIYLRNLKQRLEEVWEQFGKDSPLDNLIYARDHYGVMQREELKDIINALAALKMRTDSLLAECLAIPSNRRLSCSESRKLPTNEDNDGIY